MKNTSTAAIVFVAVVGAGSVVARMAPGEERALPYQGVLERDGVAVTGTVTGRFGLVTSLSASTACVLTNTCPLWSEEQEFDVVDGRFSIILGDGTGPRTLSDAVLASPTLFLSMAIKTEDDDDFTALGGVQEIVPTPLASRAAVADAAAVASAVRPGGVNAAAIAGGTISRDKLAPTLFFSADMLWNGANHDVTNSAPAGWLLSNLGFGPPGSATFFPIINTPPNGFKCVATSIDAPRVFNFTVRTPTQITVQMFDVAGNLNPGSFTLMCEGF